MDGIIAAQSGSGVALAADRFSYVFGRRIKLLRLIGAEDDRHRSRGAKVRLVRRRKRSGNARASAFSFKKRDATEGDSRP